MSIQQLSFRSTIFVPSPDNPRSSALISGGAGGNRNPRGTIFIFHSDTFTKLRQELVEFMESQGYRWIGTAGAPIVAVVRLILLLSVLCGGAIWSSNYLFPISDFFFIFSVVHAGIDDLFCRPDKVSVPESLV